MDIYSSKKKARRAASHYKSSKNGKKENIFTRIKKWFLKMPKKKRAIVITLMSFILVLTVALGSIVGVFFWLTEDYNYNPEVGKNEELNQIVPIDEGIVNIALFGIDARTEGKFTGLSDSIMILSLNTRTGKINIISVMRDSLVEIPGKSVGKINSAYNTKEGAILAIKTLNYNFNLDIKEYATVNFFGMAEIIDAVGGIEVDVQENEIDGYRCLNDLINEFCIFTGDEPVLVKKAGLQTLNGMQAVSWSRIRRASTAEGESNDYGRTDRQRYVMEQLLYKALDTSVKDYPKLIKALLPHMETSLSYSEILKLSGMLTKNITFEQTRIPQHSYTMTGPIISRVGSYVYYNLDFAADIIHAIIYEDMTQDEYIELNGVVKKGWYTGPVDSTSSSSTGTSSEVDEPEPDIDGSEPVESDEVSSDSASDGNSSSDTSSEDTGSEPESSEAETSSEDISSSEETQ